LEYTVISVGERMIRSRDPTVPLTGGPMQIFAPTVTKIETEIDAVGIFSTFEKAQAAASVYIESNPGHRVKIKAAVVDAVTGGPAPAAGQVCTGCGRPIAAGGLCDVCRKAHWAACRTSDPELLEQLQAAVGS
jgi:hypothetical protein